MHPLSEDLIVLDRLILVLGNLKFFHFKNDDEWKIYTLESAEKIKKESSGKSQIPDLIEPFIKFVEGSFDQKDGIDFKEQMSDCYEEIMTMRRVVKEIIEREEGKRNNNEYKKE